jgi:hypothetical protein
MQFRDSTTHFASTVPGLPRAIADAIASQGASGADVRFQQTRRMRRRAISL